MFHLRGDYPRENEFTFRPAPPPSAVISPDAKAEKNYSGYLHLFPLAPFYSHVYTHDTGATCSASGDSARIFLPWMRCECNTRSRLNVCQRDLNFCAFAEGRLENGELLAEVYNYRGVVAVNKTRNKGDRSAERV